MQVSTRASLFAIAMAPAAFAAQTAAAHNAGACNPEIQAPAGTVQTAPQLMIGVDMSPSNCQVDQISIYIRDVETGNAVYSVDDRCCDVITSYSPVVDHRIPAGELRRGTDYEVEVYFYDRGHVFQDADRSFQNGFFTTAQ
ncbi:hypothetical protein C2I36_06805 [Rhodobacteraceae bacterium WD3A24]|nr:hypothetical protein C2I36_06805 [Rhodobacteraceae bacterium WD3A24]